MQSLMNSIHTLHRLVQFNCDPSCAIYYRFVHRFVKSKIIWIAHMRLYGEIKHLVSCIGHSCNQNAHRQLIIAHVQYPCASLMDESDKSNEMDRMK